MSLSKFTFKNIATIVLVTMFFLAPLSFTSAADLSSGMEASFVLGQDDFTSDAYITSATGMTAPHGIAFDNTNDRVFVALSGQSPRVLVYSTLAHENGQAAMAVLGHPDFTESLIVPSPFTSTMSGPRGLAYDEERQLLFVSDASFHRVLVFDVSTITDGEDAIHVLGQENFIAASANRGGPIGPGTLNYPEGLAYDSNKELLYVVDTSNNRVLVFDVSTITDGEDAIHVLGQENFIANSWGSGVSGMYYPSDVALDESGQILYVADHSNGRVIIFDVNTITDGEPAVGVLGKGDMVTTGSTAGQNGLGYPSGISFQQETGYLYVVDDDKPRILIFDTSGGVTNGMDATYVLGQPDFDTVGANWGGELVSNGKGGFVMAPSDKGFGGGAGMQRLFLAINDATDLLYFADRVNNRVLIFDLSPTPPSLSHSNSFTESLANDGSLDGSIIATLTNDVFMNVGSTLTLNTHYTLTNAPAGLTPVMTVNNDGSEATLTFTGNALNHENINDVANLTITFLDGAFANTATASDVTNYEYTTGSIDFNDAVEEQPTLTRRSSGSSTSQSRALAQKVFADHYATTETTNETPALCPVDQIITQNLRAPSRNGVYNSYTGGIVLEIDILQTHLNRLGFNSGPVDGIAGPLTDGAIKRMQTFLGTTPDGFVGPITRALLNTSCSSQGLQTN